MLVHYREGSTLAKIDLFQRLRSSILYFIQSKKNIEDTFNEYNNKYSGYLRSYYNSIEHIARTFDKFLIEFTQKKIDIKEDPFIEAYKEIHDKVKLIDDKDPFITHKEYIIPIKELCKNGKIVSGDLRVANIIDDVMNADHQMNNIQNAKKFYTNYFVTIARDLNTNSQLIVKYFNKLSTNKLIVK